MYHHCIDSSAISHWEDAICQLKTEILYQWSAVINKLSHWHVDEEEKDYLVKNMYIHDNCVLNIDLGSRALLLNKQGQIKTHRGPKQLKILMSPIDMDICTSKYKHKSSSSFCSSFGCSHLSEVATADVFKHPHKI